VAEVTIEQLGSIGELVAAIATVATLAYLALQIRGSAIATRAESRRAVRSDAAAANRLIAGSTDVAAIFAKGLANPDALTPPEAIQFRFLISEYLASIEASYKEWREGAAEEREVLDVIRHSRVVLATPGGRQFWRDLGSGYNPDFGQYLRTHLELESPSETAEQEGAAPDSA
jgi:hypothetical protein